MGTVFRKTAHCIDDYTTSCASCTVAYIAEEPEKVLRLSNKPAFHMSEKLCTLRLLCTKRRSRAAPQRLGNSTADAARTKKHESYAQNHTITIRACSGSQLDQLGPHLEQFRKVDYHRQNLQRRNLVHKQTKKNTTRKAACYVFHSPSRPTHPAVVYYKFCREPPKTYNIYYPF